MYSLPRNREQRDEQSHAIAVTVLYNITVKVWLICSESFAQSRTRILISENGRLLAYRLRGLPFMTSALEGEERWRWVVEKQTKVLISCVSGTVAKQVRPS